MHLGFAGCFSFFALSQFSLYVVILLLVLGSSLGRAKQGPTQSTPPATLVLQAPRGAWLALVASFLVVLLFPLTVTRGVEFSGFSASLHVSAASFKWLFFVYSVGAILVYLLALLSPAHYSLAFVEFFVAALLLIQVWAWLSLQTNWLAVLLFLEIAALALLLFSAYTFNRGLVGAPQAGGSAEADHNTDFSFLKFFIFFLWLSVSATFFFFWALALSYSTWLGFDLHTIYLLNAHVWAAGPSNAHALNVFVGFLGLGFLFKLLLVPLQGALLTLYGVFSFSLLLLYFVFYYFFFLFTAFLSFGLIFYVFWGGWGFVVVWLATIALLSLLFCAYLEVDFRQIFAMSSLVNLTLTFLFVL